MFLHLCPFLYIYSPMRIYNLDYLRGLAAFSIMIYHYFLFTYGKPDASTVLGRLGIYGVSVFYILSGLTLFLAYKNRMNNKRELGEFFVKRIFRIFPLLWLATIATLLLYDGLPTMQNIFLNFSGLFGFVAWDQNIATGAWSIGNELVFYLVFPLFFFLMRLHKLAMVALLAGFFALYLWFAFRSDATIWSVYTNPLNQVFLFAAGFVMGWISKNINQAIVFILLSIGGLLFGLLPVTGEQMSLVAGWNRIIFTGICILICFSFFKLTKELPQIIDLPLRWLGKVSYSLYLLHPLVYSFMAHFISTGLILALVSGVITLFWSHVTFNLFEKPFVKMGGKIKLKFIRA